MKPTAPTAIPCDVPPWTDDPSAIVIVDWSSWIHRAFAVAEMDMMSHVVGWLCGMLAYQPAHAVLALDAPPPTRRHRMKHPLDPDWRYKGDRPPKPEHFFTLAAKCTEIAELHAIPCLWSAEEEADDVIATVTAQARALGYRVWIATSDKDLHGLVEESETDGGPVQLCTGIWDRFPGLGTGACGIYRGPAEVRAKWGVQPAQMADLLAIAGDSGDGIPGVKGIGFGKAAEILRAYGTLDAALTEPAWTAADLAPVEQRIALLGKTANRATGAAERAGLMLKRAIEKNRVSLIEQAALARFCRDLTSLDCGLDLAVPWEDAATGGYDVPALRRRYQELGYARKAELVESATYPKRAPWSVPRYARAG